ncbi:MULTISPECIES: class I SAM-dependent methyltransferase [Oceanobacillus]|uniref:Methyltransferase n=1 Tax=Oceanobacillus indicireducens TaxID=1004261 RepID=A0A918D193_9BACI|nr:MULTISPECIES: class I SAM-dependent methyltransferase [Oceanobacillus]GGN55976.1 methyltransferase [Oceanobacillus indicireducens]
MLKQYKYDKLLGIRTGANRFVKLPVSYHNNPYEATSYETLETLIEHYPITENDCFVDFGCGKGRINFYLHHFTGASVKGVEMEDDLLADAIENLAGYQMQHPDRLKRIEFLNCPAQEYQIAPEDNRFYFFNPFSVKIFQKVVHNILKSVEEYPRSIDLLIYYPHAEYIYYLEKNTSFELVQEITIDIFYKNDSDDRILIYRI